VVRYSFDLDGGDWGAFGALAMSGAAFLRIKKLKGGGIITVAARHNKREIQAELGAAGSIDPTRSHLNYSLAGPAAAGDVGQLAKDLMTAAGVTKLRKDAVQALEIVFSLPPGNSLDDRAYFTDCVAWAGRYFGGVTLGVDIHLDEAAPHCHVLLLPLIDGRMAGSDMLGGKQMLAALQKDFFDQVAAAYGLSKAPARLAGASKEAAAKAVLQTLRDTGDKALQSKVWATLRDVIERDPAPFLLALGIELQAPEKKLKTFTQIMTSKGKGKAKEANPIGFTPPEKRQTLCSVGFTPKAPPPPASKAPQPAPAPAMPDKPVNEISEAPDQLLTDTPNDDSEIKAPALHDTHDLDQIDAGEVMDSLKLWKSQTQPDQRGQGVCSNLDTPFIETTTRHRDCDQSPDRFHDGNYCQPAPPPARLKRQAADGWVNAELATRSKAGATACHR
jgi:hypothetical protein